MIWIVLISLLVSLVALICAVNRDCGNKEQPKLQCNHKCYSADWLSLAVDQQRKVINYLVIKLDKLTDELNLEYVEESTVQKEAHFKKKAKK